MQTLAVASTSGRSNSSFRRATSVLPLLLLTATARLNTAHTLQFFSSGCFDTSPFIPLEATRVHIPRTAHLLQTH